MRLPTPLLRRNPDAHKNDFGHVLILAGSANMLGAAALASLAAMRGGAGLVTVGIPESLNSAIQKKLSPVIMTLPLKESPQQSLSLAAFSQIRDRLSQFDAVALGPGLSTVAGTKRFALKTITECPSPMVIDADALNILSINPGALKKTKTLKIITPHPGEMARLTGLTKANIENRRRQVARDFAKKFQCVVLLKGHRTVIASAQGSMYTNTTGNVGMATAGSGDVLTGIIVAFLAQGLSGFDAAKFGAFVHGMAGDLAARKKTKLSMIATDIIEQIPSAIAKN